MTKDNNIEASLDSGLSGLLRKAFCQGVAWERYGSIPFGKAVAETIAALQADRLSAPAPVGYAPCPRCKQYNHSIGDDELAEAFRHFHTMIAHPVRGHALDDAFDDRTKDMAQRLVAAAKHNSAPVEAADQVEAVWQALKDRLCADPVKATRCVMVGRADIAAAIAAIGQSPAVEERESIVAWLRQPGSADLNDIADAISRGEHKEGK